MKQMTMTRRQFTQRLVAGILLAGCGMHRRSRGETAVQGPPVRVSAAAIQMVPKLGDVEWNLNQAEALLRQALQKGARWVVLPEMFTSAAAFHPDMLGAIQPLDGPPLRLMQQMARQGNAMIGGSFLARRGLQVFNTFVLVFPDGTFAHHDKDLPTYWENCYYRPGDDDGVLSTPVGPVGSALCWELIRSRTARRLLGRVRMVLGGSCWWTLPDDADPDSPRRAANLRMLQQAAPRLARLVGVPVIHGSHAGRFEGYFSPELPDVPYHSEYLGEAMIVDASGRVLARRGKDEGEGVVVAEVVLPASPAPSEIIPDAFWMPKEMPGDWKDSWERWFDKGVDYYAMVTEPFLKTGEINEYVPRYLR